MHFGEGERLFYGQVQDVAMPIRQALAQHPEPGSPRAAQLAPNDAPPSPREPDCPSLHSGKIARPRTLCFFAPVQKVHRRAACALHSTKSFGPESCRKLG